MAGFGAKIALVLKIVEYSRLHSRQSVLVSNVADAQASVL
jgi:hypothetical protein